MAPFEAQGSPSSRMPRAQLAVFSGGGRDFSIGDVLAFGTRAGTAVPVRPATSRGVRPAVASDVAVESAIEQFRYRHELISADECEHWLAARGLVYGDLHDSLARRLSGVAVATAAEFEVDGILADNFAMSARALASRVALAIERGLPMPPSGAIAEGQWIQWDAAFRDACWQVASPEQCRRTLAVLRPALVQVEFEIAEFDGDQVAREARWCVIEDRQSLREIAQMQQYPLRVEQAYVDDLPAAWAAALVATAPGAVSAVVSDGERHLLLAPLRMIEPSLDLPEVAVRVEQHLADQYFNALMQTHVRWIIPMTAGP